MKKNKLWLLIITSILFSLLVNSVNAGNVTGCVETATLFNCSHGTFLGQDIIVNKTIWIENATIDGDMAGDVGTGGWIRLETNGSIYVIDSQIDAQEKTRHTNNGCSGGVGGWANWTVIAKDMTINNSLINANGLPGIRGSVAGVCDYSRNGELGGKTFVTLNVTDVIYVRNSTLNMYTGAGSAGWEDFLSRRGGHGGDGIVNINTKQFLTNNQTIINIYGGRGGAPRCYDQSITGARGGDITTTINTQQTLLSNTTIIANGGEGRYGCGVSPTGRDGYGRTYLNTSFVTTWQYTTSFEKGIYPAFDNELWIHFQNKTYSNFYFGLLNASDTEILVTNITCDESDILIITNYTGLNDTTVPIGIDSSCGTPTYVNISEFNDINMLQSNITPTPAFANDTLQGWCQAITIIEEPLTYTAKWYRNDILINTTILPGQTQGTLINIANLSSTYTTEEDIFILECTANNSVKSSNSLNSTPLTISYLPPTPIENISFDPSQNISGNITIGGQTNISWQGGDDPLYNGTMSYDIEGNISGGWFSIVTGTLDKWFDWVVDVFYDGLADIRIRGISNISNVSTEWEQVEIYINSTNSTVKINQLYITPTNPLDDDTINCNFNLTAPLNETINATITWFATYDNITWVNITDYDYTYTNINRNQLYTTGVGTGSVVAGPPGVWSWKCEIDTYMDIYFENLGDYYHTIQNSTQAYPFSIDLISPPNLYESNQPLNVSFKVIDMDGTNIQCTLKVNDTTTITETGILHNTTTNITHTPATDGVYLWNLSCNTTENPTPITTPDRTFTYDGQPPTFSNFTNNQNIIFPEIGDNITLGVTIDDTYTIDTCQLWVNAIGIFTNEGNFSIMTTGPYNLTMNYTVTNASAKPNENVTWRVWCNDSAGNSNYSQIQNFTVKDVTLPGIIINANNSFGTNNDSVISNALQNLTLSVTYLDFNLFQAEINITCDDNGTIYYWNDTNITSTNFTYTKNDEVDLTGLPLQQCTFFTQVSDDHTEEEIKKYDINKLEEGLQFITDKNIIIDIISEEGKQNVKDKKTKKEKDRYKFGFEYEDKKLERTYTIRSNNKIYERPNSEYPGHLVVWNEQQKTGHWIDFDEIGLQNKKYTINRINDYEYQITIKAIIPEDIKEKKQKKDKKDKEEQGFFDKLFGKDTNLTEEEWILENYGINDIEFNSIGGLNINNATYYFYIGAAINISTLNIYDNQTFNQTAWPLTVKVTTLNSPSPINGTIQINYSYPYINNTLTLGNFTLEFYSPHYFNQTYTVEVTNNSQNLTYTSFQSVLNVRAYNVKTFINQTGLNLTVTNTNTTVQTNETNTTTIWTTFYLDKDPYNLLIQKEDYQDKTISFNMAYRENKTIEEGLSFLATFNFIDERTLEPFNLSSADRVTFLLFCPNSTFTTIINETNQSIPIDCDYIKFKFILDYGTESYYRTFILSPNEANNVNIYLINLLTTNALFNSFHVDDLLNNYDNIRIFIKKIVGNETAQITADYVDIEDKIGAFLIENNEYIIEVHSDNNPVRIMGTYGADTSGDKNLRLYDISLNATAIGMEGTLFQVQTENRTGNETYALLRFQDIYNTTTSITWSLYAGSVGGTLISQITSSSKNFTAEQNVTAYTNGPIYSKLDITTPTGTYSDTRPVYDTYKIISQFIKDYNIWIIWAITILISIIAIMASIKTANVTAVAITAIAFAFSLIGWFPIISKGILALTALVSIMLMLKQGDKNIGS